MPQAVLVGSLAGMTFGVATVLLISALLEAGSSLAGFALLRKAKSYRTLIAPVNFCSFAILWIYVSVFSQWQLGAPKAAGVLVSVLLIDWLSTVLNFRVMAKYEPVTVTASYSLAPVFSFLVDQPMRVLLGAQFIPDLDLGHVLIGMSLVMTVAFLGDPDPSKKIQGGGFGALRNFFRAVYVGISKDPLLFLVPGFIYAVSGTLTSYYLMETNASSVSVYALRCLVIGLLSFCFWSRFQAFSLLSSIPKALFAGGRGERQASLLVRIWWQSFFSVGAWVSYYIGITWTHPAIVLAVYSTSIIFSELLFSAYFLRKLRWKFLLLALTIAAQLGLLALWE